MYMVVGKVYAYLPSIFMEVIHFDNRVKRYKQRRDCTTDIIKYVSTPQSQWNVCEEQSLLRHFFFRQNGKQSSGSYGHVLIS